ncbi:MAG: ABC transporter permease subunit [Clostridia bacterium]|nr:ABC transporter permease subunit [Clostridia bacterium]
MSGKLINKTIFNNHKKSLLYCIFWSLLIAGMMVVTISMFPIVAKAVKGLPEEIKQYLSGMENINNYFEAEASELWVLFICIYGAVLSFNMVTKELKGTACEVVYTSPASRGEILRSKAIYVLINVTIANVFVAAFSYMSLCIWGDPFSLGNFFVYTLFAWLATLVVSYFAFGMCVFMGKKMSPLSIIAILAFVYIMAMFSQNVQVLSYFTPLSAISGGILINGFGGVQQYGIPLIIWMSAAVVINVLGFCKFKNSDIC